MISLVALTILLVPFAWSADSTGALFRFSDSCTVHEIFHQLLQFGCFTTPLESFNCFSYACDSPTKRAEYKKACQFPYNGHIDKHGAVIANIICQYAISKLDVSKLGEKFIPDTMKIVKDGLDPTNIATSAAQNTSAYRCGLNLLDFAFTTPVSEDLWRIVMHAGGYLVHQQLKNCGEEEKKLKAAFLQTNSCFHDDVGQLGGGIVKLDGYWQIIALRAHVILGQDVGLKTNIRPCVQDKNIFDALAEQFPAGDTIDPSDFLVTVASLEVEPGKPKHLFIDLVGGDFAKVVADRIIAAENVIGNKDFQEFANSYKQVMMGVEIETGPLGQRTAFTWALNQLSKFDRFVVFPDLSTFKPIYQKARASQYPSNPEISALIDTLYTQ